MPKPKRRKIFSGAFVIATLENKFGFQWVSQKGSHVKLRGGAGGKYVTIIPLHKELSPGTLRGALELAGLTLEKFQDALAK